MISAFVGIFTLNFLSKFLFTLHCIDGKVCFPKIKYQAKGEKWFKYLLTLFVIYITAVEPFLSKYISETVLRKLIKQNIVVELNPNHDENNCIIREGVSCDYFVLVLQGLLPLNNFVIYVGDYQIFCPAKFVTTKYFCLPRFVTSKYFCYVGYVTTKYFALQGLWPLNIFVLQGLWTLNIFLL